MSEPYENDGPTMADVCMGDVCCECQEYNYPKPCPCGEPSDDGDAS